MHRFSTSLGLAIALGLCAGRADALGVGVTGTFQVSITPNTDLSDLYLLFDSGDHQDAISLGPATAPAAVTTNFSLPFTLPSCNPFIYSPAQCGPYVGIVAVNTDETPNGIDVAIDPTQATAIINSHLSFTDPDCSSGAFPGFCFFANPDSLAAEAALVGGLEDPFDTNAYSQGLSGSQAASAFAGGAQPQLPLFNTLTNTATLSLVSFSNAQSGGSVSLDFTAEGPLIGAPEPATMGLLAAGLLLFGYRRLTSRS